MTPQRLARLIRHTRRAQGITLPALAERTGLAKSIIQKIEDGTGNPCLSTLRQLCRALNLTLTIR